MTVKLSHFANAFPRQDSGKNVLGFYFQLIFGKMFAIVKNTILCS